MKERPIIFSGPMVRAILEGRKTQTRRICKLDIPADQEEVFTWFIGDLRESTCGPFAVEGLYVSTPRGLQWLGACPYGVPGDRLWVRETWQFQPASAIAANGKYEYAATVKDWCHPPTWRPSIHMPRCASRISLEVVSVRVERVQDISEADAVAEGMKPRPSEPYDCMDDPREQYRFLWDEINGPGSWEANPWVWVIRFNVIGVNK